MARMHNFHRSRSGKLQEGVGVVKEEEEKKNALILMMEKRWVGERKRNINEYEIKDKL